MSKKAQGSKNNILARGKKIEYEFNGQKVKPVKFIGVDGRSVIVIQNAQNSEILMENNLPIPFSMAKKML